MLKIGVTIATALVAGAAVALFMRGPTPREEPPLIPPLLVASAPPEVSPADSAFAAITASWSNEQLSACAPVLRDALGTRELVQGALDAVRDPRQRARPEIADAKDWFRLGDESLESQRPALQRGDCEGAAMTALEQATQYYVKAGAAALRAAQIAGS